MTTKPNDYGSSKASSPSSALARSIVHQRSLYDGGVKGVNVSTQSQRLLWTCGAQMYQQSSYYPAA